VGFIFYFSPINILYDKNVAFRISHVYEEFVKTKKKRPNKTKTIGQLFNGIVGHYSKSYFRPERCRNIVNRRARIYTRLRKNPNTTTIIINSIRLLITDWTPKLRARSE